MNEMKIIADKMGLNIFEVIEAASTKPFGFKNIFRSWYWWPLYSNNPFTLHGRLSSMGYIQDLYSLLVR